MAFNVVKLVIKTIAMDTAFECMNSSYKKPSKFWLHLRRRKLCCSSVIFAVALFSISISQMHIGQYI